MKILTADDAKRVRIPDAKPRQAFDYARTEDGVITLTPVKKVEGKEKAAAKVRFEKRGRYTVGIPDRAIDMAAFKQALEEYP